MGRTLTLFRELRARYKASAAPELVVLCGLLRKMLPRYWLGSSELLPGAHADKLARFREG